MIGLRRGGSAVGLGLAGAVASMLCVAHAAGVLSVPTRKPGQWELRLNTGAAPEAVLHICIDEATDKEMMDASLSIVTSLCPTPAWSREGDTLVVQADCQIAPGRTAVLRGELSGDFQSNYVFTLHSKTGLGAAATVDLKHEYRWMANSCTGALRPGYVRLPNGGTMKLKQMMKLLENINDVP